MPNYPDNDPDVRLAKHRFWKRWLGRAAVVVLVPAFAYGVVAYRYWTNRPKLTRNFAAEWNAEIAKTPLDQRAWPVYRQVLIEIADGLRQAPFDEAVHALNDDKAAEWVRKHEAAWEKARQASRLPALGYFYSDVTLPEDRGVGLRYAEPGVRAQRLSQPPDVPSENPPTFELLLTAQGESRDLGVGLAADALLAARDGDGRRATADLKAIFALSTQLVDTQSVVATMIARRRFIEGLHAWGTVMQRFPAALDDAQLQEIAAAAARVDLRTGLTGETAMMYDFVQRMYTDDGAGDGYFFLPAVGSGLLVDILQRPPLTFIERAAAPLTTHRYASRRETLDQYDRWQKLLAADLARPYWADNVWQADAMRDTLRSRPHFQLLYPLLFDAEPLHRSIEGVIQRRDAVQTAAALRRYRNKHQAWPKALTELVPDFLPELPLDRFTGEPLKYLPDDVQSVLYSVGNDRRDDGGRPAQVTSTHRPMPGTDLETNTEAWHWNFEAGLPHNPFDGDLILWPVDPPRGKAKRPQYDPFGAPIPE